jgi:hypothetical protein
VNKDSRTVELPKSIDLFFLTDGNLLVNVERHIDCAERGGYCATRLSVLAVLLRKNDQCILHVRIRRRLVI